MGHRRNSSVHVKCEAVGRNGEILFQNKQRNFSYVHNSVSISTCYAYLPGFDLSIIIQRLISSEFSLQGTCVIQNTQCFLKFYLQITTRPIFLFWLTFPIVPTIAELFMGANMFCRMSSGCGFMAKKGLFAVEHRFSCIGGTVLRNLVNPLYSTAVLSSNAISFGLNFVAPPMPELWAIQFAIIFKHFECPVWNRSKYVERD